ncbi:unnamed protein product [Amoebophrya sp. A120]|nr:unnamed protein product [Amoebophrya sp. A120]|eukprot:GSA120T00010668001.1
MYALSRPLHYSRNSGEFLRMQRRMQGVKWRRWWNRANNEHYIKAKRKNPLMKEEFLEFSRAPSVPHFLRDNRIPQKVDLAYHMNVKQGDLVQVLYGRDSGRQGVVRKVMRKENCVLVHGMNMKKTFRVNTAVGETLCTTELPIHITNVAPVDPILKKPTRVKRRYTMHGECVRISKVSGCAMPDPVPIIREDREELLKRFENQSRVHKKYKGITSVNSPVVHSTEQQRTMAKRHYQMLARMAATPNFLTSGTTSYVEVGV